MMNNEIKEMLELHIKNDIDLLPKNQKTVLDYITNLQQENERLKQDYINVKNYIVLRKVDSEVQDKATLYNIELENINKKRYEDYKSRCEEASKIIKEIYKDDNWYKNYEYNDLEDALKEIDKILNGRSDE